MALYVCETTCQQNKDVLYQFHIIANLILAIKKHTKIPSKTVLLIKSFDKIIFTIY